MMEEDDELPLLSKAAAAGGSDGPGEQQEHRGRRSWGGQGVVRVDGAVGVGSSVSHAAALRVQRVQRCGVQRMRRGMRARVCCCCCAPLLRAHVLLHGCTVLSLTRAAAVAVAAAFTNTAQGGWLHPHVVVRPPPWPSL